MATSLNNTIVTAPGSMITDANGNQWSLQNGKVVVNGRVDTTTANVTVLAYENGKIWQMNASHLWWDKAKPTDAWGPTYGTSISPLVGVASQNNTILVGSVTSWDTKSFTDSDNDRWSITANGQVAVNGVADPTTARVTALAYEKGVIWQQNQDGLWWSKANASAAWSPTYGTTNSPIPAGVAAPEVYYVSGAVVNYVNTVAPASYTAHTIADGAITFNYRGNNVNAGTVLATESELRLNVSGTLTNSGFIITQQLGIYAATTNISLAPNSLLKNTGFIETINGVRSSTLNITGSGALENDGQFFTADNAITNIQSKVTGSGLFILGGTTLTPNGSKLEFGSSVSAGETVLMGGKLPQLNVLQLDHSMQFLGAISQFEVQSQVYLANTNVTSATWHPTYLTPSAGTLDLFSGSLQVADLHFTNMIAPVSKVTDFEIRHVGGDSIIMAGVHLAFMPLTPH